MTDDFDWQALDRVLAGDGSATDDERVRAWMSASPERQAMVESLRRSGDRTTPVDLDRAWRRVAARTVLTTGVAWRRTVGWVAAAAVVIAAASLVSARMLRTSAKSTTQVATAWRDITAPLGHRTSVTLPDSSHVVLNAGSSLRYSTTFGQSDREVFLTGEGYFAVRHDAALPFRVRANNAAIQDVGTRFVVRAYDATHGTIVVVAEGAVGIATAGSTGHDTVFVTAGVLARMATTGAVTTTAVDAARYTGFSNGLLVLGDLTLGEAIPVIERWYDVRIYVTDPALRRRALSADFRDQPLSSVLDALALALDVDIRRDERLVTISPRSAR